MLGEVFAATRTGLALPGQSANAGEHVPAKLLCYNYPYVTRTPRTAVRRDFRHSYDHSRL